MSLVLKATGGQHALWPENADSGEFRDHRAIIPRMLEGWFRRSRRRGASFPALPVFLLLWTLLLLCPVASGAGQTALAQQKTIAALAVAGAFNPAGIGTSSRTPPRSSFGASLPCNSLQLSRSRTLVAVHARRSTYPQLTRCCRICSPRMSPRSLSCPDSRPPPVPFASPNHNVRSAHEITIPSKMVSTTASVGINAASFSSHPQ
jgi:hypothetical protein